MLLILGMRFASDYGLHKEGFMISCLLKATHVPQASFFCFFSCQYSIKASWLVQDQK